MSSESNHVPFPGPWTSTPSMGQSGELWESPELAACRLGEEECGLSPTGLLRAWLKTRVLLRRPGAWSVRQLCALG